MSSLLQMHHPPQSLTPALTTDPDNPFALSKISSTNSNQNEPYLKSKKISSSNSIQNVPYLKSNDANITDHIFANEKQDSLSGLHVISNLASTVNREKSSSINDINSFSSPPDSTTTKSQLSPYTSNPILSSSISDVSILNNFPNSLNTTTTTTTTTTMNFGSKLEDHFYKNPIKSEIQSNSLDADILNAANVLFNTFQTSPPGPKTNPQQQKKSNFTSSPPKKTKNKMEYVPISQQKQHYHQNISNPSSSPPLDFHNKHQYTSTNFIDTHSISSLNDPPLHIQQHPHQQKVSNEPPHYQYDVAMPIEMQMSEEDDDYVAFSTRKQQQYDVTDYIMEEEDDDDGDWKTSGSGKNSVYRTSSLPNSFEGRGGFLNNNTGVNLPQHSVGGGGSGRRGRPPNSAKQMERTTSQGSNPAGSTSPYYYNSPNAGVQRKSSASPKAKKLAKAKQPGSKVKKDLFGGDGTLDMERSESSDTVKSAGSGAAQLQPGSRMCSFCSATSTPMWRHGPPGYPDLCNKCGVKNMRGRLFV